MPRDAREFVVKVRLSQKHQIGAAIVAAAFLYFVIAGWVSATYGPADDGTAGRFFTGVLWPLSLPYNLGLGNGSGTASGATVLIDLDHCRALGSHLWRCTAQ